MKQRILPKILLSFASLSLVIACQSGDIAEKDHKDSSFINNQSIVFNKNFESEKKEPLEIEKVDGLGDFHFEFEGGLPCENCDLVYEHLALMGDTTSGRVDFEFQAFYTKGKDTIASENEKGSVTIHNGFADDPKAIVYELNKKNRKNNLYLKMSDQALLKLDDKGKSNNFLYILRSKDAPYSEPNQ